MQFTLTAFSTPTQPPLDLYATPHLSFRLQDRLSLLGRRIEAVVEGQAEAQARRASIRGKDRGVTA